MIRDEIARLPPDASLVESGVFQVFCATADRIPTTVREIGRLREITYRAIGEGTGRMLDLDAFDGRYKHLFMWDRDRQRVAGAYRIGETDAIVDVDGVAGLYTRTLFRYDASLFERIGGPALELGRSFVCSEYQKNYNALALLWKGIGQFVARAPQYRYLFGPVSVSARYSDTSNRLLIEFLHQHHLDRELASVVEAVNPTAPLLTRHGNTVAPRNVDEVDRLITAAECDGKRMPVLLRQYLKLNARLIGFNVDPAFSDALDALMIVDLVGVDRTILARYLGRTAALSFLAFHQSNRSLAA